MRRSASRGSRSNPPTSSSLVDEKRVHSFLLSSAARDPGARVGFFGAHLGGACRGRWRAASSHLPDRGPPGSRCGCSTAAHRARAGRSPGRSATAMGPRGRGCSTGRQAGPALPQDPLHLARRAPTEPVPRWRGCGTTCSSPAAATSGDPATPPTILALHPRYVVGEVLESHVHVGNQQARNQGSEGRADSAHADHVGVAGYAGG
jgi:hypothetical protein